MAARTEEKIHASEGASASEQKCSESTVKPRTSDWISVSNSSAESQGIENLKNWLDKTIQTLDKNHPEWRDKKTHWFASDEGDGECTLSLNYSRYMTEEELHEADFRRKMAKENAVRSMKMLIKNNLMEAIDFIKELKEEK